MDLNLLRTIQVYKKEGWKIEGNSVGTTGVGYLISPRGDAFLYDDIMYNRGLVPWDVFSDEDENMAREFENLYELIRLFYGSCRFEKGMENMLDG